MFLSCSTSIALQDTQFSRFASLFHSSLYTANDESSVGSVSSRFSKPAVPTIKTNTLSSRAYKVSGPTFQENPKLFCFGLGYTGEAIAKTLKNTGWNVAGTCRSNTKRQFLLNSDIDAHIFDPELTGNGLMHEAILALQSSTHLLSTIPPSVIQSYDPVLKWHFSDIVSAKESGLSWIGYLSTTSVYGDWNGEWVNESCSVRPMDPKAKKRVIAEEGWLGLGKDSKIPTHVFRLGGIYGPGRSALDTLRRNENPSANQKRRESQLYTTRCHVADVCQVIQASMAQPRNGGIYNVVDDCPASRREVMAFARSILGLPSVPPNKNFTGEIETRRGKGEKRVENSRIKEELGANLIFPDYKAGLLSIVEQEEQ